MPDLDDGVIDEPDDVVEETRSMSTDTSEKGLEKPHRSAWMTGQTGRIFRSLVVRASRRRPMAAAGS